jgi:hypothetical protein
MRSLRANEILVFIMLSYAVVLSVFVDASNRNYLVLLAAGLGGAMFLVFQLALNLQASLATLVLGAMAVQAFSIDGFGALGSVMLTAVYATGFFAVPALLERVSDKRRLIETVLRRLIYAYAILSLIQMTFSLAGLSVPNLIASKGLWSYNSLAFEPSHLGRVVGISMLAYMLLVRLPLPSGAVAETPRVGFKVVMAFFSTMLLSGSALAILAIIVVYLLSRSMIWTVLSVAAALLIWPTLLVVDYDPVRRMAVFLSSLGSLNFEELMQVEQSGAIRIAPALIYLRDFSMTEIGFWFGYGQNGLVQYFLGKIEGLGDQVSVGFLPGFVVIYGVVLTAAFVWVFVLRQINRTTAPLIAFWLVFFVNSAWNTQVFWYGLLVIQVARVVSRDSSSQVGAV